MNRFLIVICLMLTPLFISAQHIISGTIVDSENKPLPGANILVKELKQNKSVGTTSSDKGEYSISLNNGKYSLEISYIGYTTYVSYVEVDGNVSLPPIVLSENAELMNEVVVTARTITYNTDGYIAEINKNPLYKEKNMATVLKMTPGTNATYNRIEVFGQSVSKVYLNGRELNLYGEQLVNYLETIDAKNVRQMEVVTASGVEEDAADKGKSVIRIITANPETGGMVYVGVNSMNGTDKNIHGMDANVNWRLGKNLGMYFNTAGAFGNTNIGNRSETHFYDTDTWRISETNVENKLNGNIRAVLGMNFDLDEKNLFSIEGIYQQNKNSNPSQSTVRNLKGNTYTDIADGSMDAVRKYKRNNLSFVYTYKFNKNTQLNFKADRMETIMDDDNRQRYEYVENDNTGYDYLNEEKDVIYTARLDYTQKFRTLNGKLSIGVKGTWIDTDTYTDYARFLNGREDDMTSYNDLYNYRENVYALYAKYALSYKKISMDLGLRVEHTYVSPLSLTNPERNYESKYTDFFPEVSLNYVINAEKGHNINLGYDRGIWRPHMESLNPLIRRTSEYSYSMGNPLLEAGCYDKYSFTTVLFNKYILDLSYRYGNNDIFSFSENDGGILYNSYYNGLKRSDFRAYLSIPIKVAEWFNLKLNANYSYVEENYGVYEENIHNWGCGFFADFTLPYNWRMDHHLFYYSSSESLFEKQSERPRYDITINKSFSKLGLNVGLTLLDVFNCAGSKRIDSFRDDFYQITKGTNNNLGITLRVGYNLRWGKKSMVRRTTPGNSEESGRVASE